MSRIWNKTLAGLALTTLGSLALAGPAIAQTGSSGGDAAERWRSMSPSEREVMRERFDRFESLPTEAQDAIRDRLSGLRERLVELEQNLAPDERRELDSMPREDRKEVLGALLRERLRFRGQSLRGALPEDLIRDLDQADPARRPWMLERHRCDLRERFGDGGGRRGEHSGRSDSRPEGWGRGFEGGRSGAGRFGERRGLFGTLEEGQREQIRERVREHFRSGHGPAGGPAPDFGQPFQGLAPERARELLEAGRPRLEEFLDRSRERAPSRHERILDAARQSGAFRPEGLEELRREPLHQLLMRLRRTAEFQGDQPLGV